MADWKSVLKADPTEWLLSEGQPWMVYHTLADILDKEKADPDAVAAKAAIAQAELLKRIFDWQIAEGGWEADILCYPCSGFPHR